MIEKYENPNQNFIQSFSNPNKFIEQWPGHYDQIQVSGPTDIMD